VIEKFLAFVLNVCACVFTQMNHKDFLLFMTLIMLLIELFIGSKFVSSTFSQVNFTKCPHPQGMVQSKYVFLLSAFQGHMMMCALRTLFEDLGH
jgi:hypothetical protein